MIPVLLLFLLSAVETNSFVPFPSGFSTVAVDKTSLVSVNSDEGFFSAEPGSPMLPLVPEVFILPGRCEVSSVSVTVQPPLSTTRLALPLAGAPVVQPVGNTPQTSFSPTEESVQAGEQSAFIHTGHILDAYTVVTCSVNPWTYDADSQQLGLSPECTVELSWSRSGAYRALSESQAEMADFRMNSLSNRYNSSYQPLHSIPGTDESTDYLIITGEDYTGQAETLETLLESRSLTYRTLTVQEIDGNWEGADVQEDIRNCIRSYAQNQGTTFVLLAGDETVVPVREVYTECEGLSEMAPSDMYYSDLDGSWDGNGNGIYGEYADSLDMYADVLLGRLLFSTPEGAEAVFNKNSAYASVSSSETWYREVVLCGAMLFPDINYRGEKGCELMAQHFPSDFNLTRAYALSNGDHPDTYFPVLYSGAGWNHYAGHGNDRGVYWIDNSGMLTINRMNGFDNPGQTGIHSCIGCHTGDFTDPGVCLIDTLLTLPEGGGVAGFFNTSWGWEGYWPQIGSTERLCNNTVEQVYTNKASSLGLAYAAAKDLEIPNMTGPYDRVMQSVIAYSGFMDPSLEVLGVANLNPIPPVPFQVVMLSGNPLTAGEELLFKVTGAYPSYDVSVYDLAGRAAHEPVDLPCGTVLSVETGALQPGIYFASAKSPGGATASESFIVLR